MHPPPPRSFDSGLRSLAANLALSLATTLIVLGGLEGLSRLFEEDLPARPVASYIAVWNDGEFYTVSSTATGWPPWEDYNRDGMRDREHPVAKRAGVRRVVMLGDSVTLGYGMRPEQAFPQVLQDVLDARGQEVEVFNVALGGWSTRQQRIAYQRIARKYDPDDVVVSVCLNDIPEIHNNLAQPPKVLHELHARSALVRRLVGARRREIHDVEELFEAPDSPSVREAFRRFFDELRRLRSEVQADGGRFGVAVLPFRMQFAAGAPAPIVQQRIATFCEGERIPFLDLLPALRPLGPAAFLDYDHLSPSGARRVAETIVDSVLLASGGDEEGRPSASPASGVEVTAASPAEWIARLRGPEPATRAAAARALGNMGTAPGAVVPVLAGALRDREASVRAAAAWALGGFGPEAASAVGALTVVLGDAHPPARAGAAHTLGAIGPAARPAAAALVPRLADPADEVRWRAEDALARIGPEPAHSLPALIELLADATGSGRAGAALVMGRMGPSARGAVPVLVSALADARADVRWKAAWALGEIGPEARVAVPALITLAGDPDIGWHAIDALGGIGPAAEAAVPFLRSALGEANGNVRWRAAIALGHIGAAAAVAAPDLRTLLRDPADSVRLAAVHALGSIGTPGAADASAVAQSLATDTDSRVRAAAALTLGRVSGREEIVRDALIAGARDGDPFVRGSAVRALGRRASSPAIEAALARAREDPDPGVRTEAVRAGRRRGH